MVTVYKTNNKASEKAIQFLKDHQIEHQVKSYKKSISQRLIMNLLEKSIDGVDPLLSKKSDDYFNIGDSLEELKLSDLISYIMNHPMLLKTPIMVDDRHVVVGFSKETIRIFFPR